ncbi:hypothetical protein NQZ68_012627 [Dissostichus eleginoides]|nr:hypothetical protein NQZ68_012627 [Dissostichus eleginoides]
MKPGAFNATIFIRTLAQATGEVDGEESWRAFTPKRASRGTAARAVFWWLREHQTPPHPSEDSSVSSPLSEEGSEELKDMLDSRGDSCTEFNTQQREWNIMRVTSPAHWVEVMLLYKPFFPFQVLPSLGSACDLDLSVQENMLVEGRLRVTLIECSRLFILGSYDRETYVHCTLELSSHQWKEKTRSSIKQVPG